MLTLAQAQQIFSIRPFTACKRHKPRLPQRVRLLKIDSLDCLRAGHHLCSACCHSRANCTASQRSVIQQPPVDYRPSQQTRRDEHGSVGKRK